jgi:hypothetical protein
LGNPVPLIIAYRALLGAKLLDKRRNENVIHPRLECRIDFDFPFHARELYLAPGTYFKGHLLSHPTRVCFPSAIKQSTAAPGFRPELKL